MNSRLRFCMITTFYPPYHFGGDAVFVQALANELAGCGHHVEVIHCKDSYRLLAHEQPVGGYEDHPDVVIHGLESHFGRLSPLATQQTGRPWLKAREIERVLSQGFDVIHYHNISLVGGPEVLTLGNAIKLYTPHEFWLVCPTHVLLRYNREPCPQPRCLLCTLSYGRPPQLWRYSEILPSAIRCVDRFLAPSRFCIEMHRARGLEAPMIHLPNFLPHKPSALTDGQPAQTSGDSPYFLFVGRLEKLKGLQTVIPVFHRYRKAHLLIAGRGDYEAPLRAMATQADNIHFLGHVSRNELRSLYAGAVALIVPSICYEIAPLVMIESFAQRTPVIARRIGGLAEGVEDGGGGFVYEDEATLVSAMDKMLDDPELRCDLGRRGYEAYLRDWTPEAYLKRYLEVIAELQGSKQPEVLYELNRRP